MDGQASKNLSFPDDFMLKKKAFHTMVLRPSVQNSSNTFLLIQF